MAEKIPFGDLKRQHEFLRKELEAVFRRNLDSGWFILGRELEKFEMDFAAYCGREYGVGVGNATDALFLALRAQGIGQGDEVITVANTAIPTVSAIVASGARPVLVDAGEDYLMDTSKIERVITPRTRAIVPVHLYGQTCDMATIKGLALKKDLQVIEDCAQAHGAEYCGVRTPVCGIGCFSFYPSKNLGAMGDGGAIVTSGAILADKLRLIRNYGQPKTYVSTTAGYNSRLDELQAAILGLKLRYLDAWNKRRREIAEIYNRALQGIVETPKENEGNFHVYHLYVIRTPKREDLKDYLSAKGIDTKIHYPVPIHLQLGFADLGYKEGDFPNSERYSKEILSLPMFPELRDEEVVKVCEEVKNWKIGRK